MAIHEFYCPQCEERFEVKRPLSQSEDEAECPKCDLKAERRYSPFSVKFFTRIDQADGEGFTRRWVPKGEICQQ